MEWWQKAVAARTKRAWVAMASRGKTPKGDTGILKLHDDVQTCEYEDVQVMWEILQQSEMVDLSSHNSKNKESLGMVSVWLGKTSSDRNRTAAYEA